mgnify:CR=1 FL=1
MTTDNYSEKRIDSPDNERLTTPPSRVQLAALMSEAEELSPHTQSIRFILGGSARYFLTVTYLSRMEGQPTWVLSSESEGNGPEDVFWSIETENPEQIYNLILKRARNVAANQAVEKKDTKTVERPKPSHNEQDEKSALFLNRYKAICEVGAGGMSRVFKAQDTKDTKLVAVKVLHPHLLHEGHSKRSTKRFEQEFKATMALGHDNIVRVQTTVSPQTAFQSW